VPDSDPPADGPSSPGTGFRGYALCGEPRCGSTYLARLLASTGIMGNPREYFGGRDAVRSANRDPEAHLSGWIRKTATPNGIYGLKIFAEQFDLVEGCGWATRLPGLRFVHIRRLDLLGQAVSLVRARQTLAFESLHPVRHEPVYSRRHIASTLNRIAHNQARWACWFARNGLDPLHLTYEEIAERPAGTVQRIHRHLGLSGPVKPGRVALEVQRDRLSETWRERFVLESGDPGYLDDDLGRIRPVLKRWRAWASK
jgi:trehalose 2-sulfotransferase